MTPTVLYISIPTNPRNSINFYTINFFIKLIGWSIFKIVRNPKNIPLLKFVTPSHILLYLNRGKTSLYVIQFILPRMINCLSASTIHARNSLKSENGGFVTIISASSLSFLTSSLLKSPSPSR